MTVLQVTLLLFFSLWIFSYSGSETDALKTVSNFAITKSSGNHLSRKISKTLPHLHSREYSVMLCGGLLFYNPTRSWYLCLATFPALFLDWKRVVISGSLQWKQERVFFGLFNRTMNSLWSIRAPVTCSSISASHGHGWFALPASRVPECRTGLVMAILSLKTDKWE